MTTLPRRANAAAAAALAALGAVLAGPARAEGDAERGRAIATSRQTGLCVLCHPVPGVDARLAGDLAPSLAGVGARLSRDALRARLVEPRRFDAASIMPSYARTDGLERVAAAWRGRPLLDAQQLDDVVAWLATLTEAPR
jgi:sulfur-oxidizing protein SoxX